MKKRRRTRKKKQERRKTENKKEEKMKEEQKKEEIKKKQTHSSDQGGVESPQRAVKACKALQRLRHTQSATGPLLLPRVCALPTQLVWVGLDLGESWATEPLGKEGRR